MLKSSLMKLIAVTIFATVFCIEFSKAQLTWSSGMPANADYDNPYKPMENIMYNNDVYQVYDGNGNDLKLARYNSKTGVWNLVQVLNNPDYNSGFRSAISGDDWYIFVTGTSLVKVYKFNFTTQTLVLCPGTISEVINTNWTVKNDPGSDKIYLAYSTSLGNEIHLTAFDVTTEQFQDYDYTSMLNSSSAPATVMKLELYMGNTDLYVGVTKYENYLVKAPLSDLANPLYYNSGQSADGLIRLNGAGLTTPQFYYLTGDGQGAPEITVQDPAAYTSYETQLTDQDVNILTGTATPQTFIVGNNDYEALEHSAYSFLSSTFSAQGSSSEDRFYIYRKENGVGPWDSLGPQIELGTYDLMSNTLRLSLENSNQQHIVAGYASSDGEYNFKVLNNKPSVITASQTISTSMCGGHNNLIYPQLEIEDADRDHIRILSVTSTNSYVQNAYAVPIGIDNSSSPGISKFAIYGFVQTQGNTQIIVTYTDGWNIFTDTLNSITITGTAPNVIFDPALSHLCNNQTNISLPDYVNYYDQGTFKINGQVIPNGLINGVELSAVQPSGSLTYDANIDGCIVSTGASYNFVTVGTASVITTPATCGATDGTATVSYTAGSSSNFTVEWSTGETTPAINNLSPGAYYYHVTDEYGCHTTGFGGIETAAIDVVESITNASCYGTNDGSIAINVTGPTNYLVIWSNGYSTPTISNLTAGEYWVTVYDQDNDCRVTYNYEVSQPSKVVASFSEDEPTCGTSDGNIYGVYAGGSGTYTFEWVGTGQTTADLYNVGYGNYELVIHDNNGCNDTVHYQLNDEQALEISEVIYPASCNYNNGAIQVNLTTDPDGGTSFPTNIEWSNGTFGAINGSLASAEYTVVVTNVETTTPFNVCHSSKSFFVPIKAPAIQPICVVTVDEATTTNLVIWERVESYGIHHYNIYRENTVAGDFRLIDTVNYTTESIFNDVVASPMDRSWRYRISQVSDCGVESPLSIAHKTLHLNAIENLGNGMFDVLWDDYEGFIDASEYVVWRNSDQNGWEALSPAVPIGTTSFTDDPPVELTGIDYYVEMISETTCIAEKAQDFNTTRSNKEKGNFIVGQGTGDSNNELDEDTIEFNVYPNPVSDELRLLTESQAIGNKLHIIGLDGIEHFSIEISDVEMIIQLNQLSQGVYLIQIDDSQQVIRLVKD